MFISSFTLFIENFVTFKQHYVFISIPHFTPTTVPQVPSTTYLPSNFMFSFYFSLMLFYLVYLICSSHPLEQGYLPVATTKNVFSLLHQYQLPTSPGLGVCLTEFLLHPCWNCGWCYVAKQGAVSS